MRLFDPSQRPATIKPVVKRTTPARLRPGDFSRTITGLIWEAPGPRTVRDLAAAVALAHGLEVTTRKAMGTLVANTRAALAKPKEGILREEAEGAYLWRPG